MGTGFSVFKDQSPRRQTIRSLVPERPATGMQYALPLYEYGPASAAVHDQTGATRIRGTRYTKAWHIKEHSLC